MCGVAGIFAYHYAANPVEREELRRIRDHMAARGPDGSGEWFGRDDRVALGHRRLAIIDLSPSGAQPMASADGQVVISFNGEIYNYRELRQSLEAQGARFRTQSDTEVLLELYRLRGTAMFAALRGMYAFILWDGNRKAMLLARDSYGIKPLYYADDGWTCRVASQVKALLAGNRVSRGVEPQGVAGFYLWGSVPEPFTLYRGIRAVPAGCFVWVDALGAGVPVEHSDIAATLANATDFPGADAGEFVHQSLLESVRDHLVADVPVGLFLSAGIDSGALLALMKEAGYADLRTITLSFEEFAGTDLDEAPLAERAAARYGARHVTRRVSFEEFRSDLPKILGAMDQPSVDGVNAWFVAKAAREQGLKVAVSGVGGDELFAGYPSFREIPRWVSWLAVPSMLPGAGRLFRLLAAPFAENVSPKFPGLVQFGGTYAGAYLLKRGLFMPWELESMLGADLVRRLPRSVVPAVPLARAGSPLARVAALEAVGYLRNQLLRDTDWASMAHSVEVRTPLVDARLLGQLAGLIRSGRIRGKRLLALSARPSLPDEARSRSKTGFLTPMNQWQDATVPRAGGGGRDHWSRGWAEYVMRSFQAAA